MPRANTAVLRAWDDERFTNCDLIPKDPADPNGPDVLLCDDCFAKISSEQRYLVDQLNEARRDKAPRITKPRATESGFTQGCRELASGAMNVAAKIPDAWAHRNDGKTMGQKASQSATGFMIFWVPISIIAFMVIFLVEFVLISAAVIAGLAYLIGAAVDSAKARKAER